MSTFTLEVLDKRIACICAEDRVTAEQTVEEPWFRENLLSVESSGERLWNGEAELILDESTPKERAVVEKRIGTSQLTDSPLSEDNAVLFLVPLDDSPALGHHHMEIKDDEDYPV